MRVFVDTNIFLDYYFDRVDSLKPLGEFAFGFFKAAVECRFTLLICTEVLEETELVIGTDREQIRKSILDNLEKAGKLKVCNATHQQAVEAGKLKKEKGLPFNDCLFAVIARDLKVKIVSRDRHFHEFDFVEAVLPEDLI